MVDRTRLDLRWSAFHHNAIAKEIRKHLQMYLVETQLDRESNLAASTALTLLMDDLAKRFKRDNSDFDPIKWLNQCSPNVKDFPLGELWDERN